MAKKTFFIAEFYDLMGTKEKPNSIKFNQQAFNTYLEKRNAWYACATHSADDKVKQKHYHYCILGHGKLKTDIIDTFGIPPRFFAPFNNSEYARHQAVRYLTHKDNPEKEQGIEVDTNEQTIYEQYLEKIENPENQKDQLNANIIEDIKNIVLEEMCYSEFYDKYPEMIMKPFVIKTLVSQFQEEKKQQEEEYRYSRTVWVDRLAMQFAKLSGKELFQFMRNAEMYLQEIKNDTEVAKIDEEDEEYKMYCAMRNEKRFSKK